MKTRIRPELSTKNKYWVSKNRHYELRYFCLQYPDWRKAYAELDGSSIFSSRSNGIPSGREPGDPTASLVEKRSSYFDKMRIVEQTAIDADPDLASYILKGVTEGVSYDQLKARLEIPCSRDTYYDRYRRFFWLLDRTRN